jgi:hypothetical protein
MVDDQSRVTGGIVVLMCALLHRNATTQVQEGGWSPGRVQGSPQVENVDSPDMAEKVAQEPIFGFAGILN